MNKLPVLRIRYAIVIDLLSMVFSFAASFVIRYEPALNVWHYLVYNQNLLYLSLLVRLPVYVAFGLYHRLWRYASTRELMSILAAGTLSSAVIYVLNFYALPALRIQHCPSHSVVVLDWLLNLACLSGSRLVLRMTQEQISARERQLLKSIFISAPRRVLVVGAGDGGAMIVREMKHNPSLGLSPIGFIDDNMDKGGLRVHGVPVLGSRHDIPALVKADRIDEVIVAMPSAPGSTLRDVQRICNEAGVLCRTMPGVYELLDGTVTLKQLREVRIEDLLRREPVVVDQAGLDAYIRDTCVLVTGAGGSIGSELCRQVARHNPAQLLLLGHGEFSIFNVERELRRRFPHLPLLPLIADVRDAERIERIVHAYRPVTIFHAAAHKHVPLMESNVEEAFTNNVLGTQCMLRAAEQHGVERFVLISTDKAVNPTSVMGATKRVAEMLVQETAARIGKPYVAVRFGNVLGSRGSVIPIFKEQIAAGGPVTITHPDMRRFFMTIPEAVQLVLQAAVLGQGGQVFILDMGEQVKIVDLVNDLIALSGLIPGDDIQIAYTGIRPGEKLYEELLLETEDYAATPHAKIFISCNTLPPQDSAYLESQIDEMAACARRMEAAQLVLGLRRLVPEFGSSPAGPQAYEE
ncbi:MAG: polysaccharide biosynthesis protein [Thermoflexales bacterium]|nr:polysaccharide biosynthesis protein [Thermoflexales bacterium]